MSPRFDGPDVSHYQGDTFPWQWCVDMHQIHFGACKMTDGAAYIDSTGEHNRNAMKAVGLRWRGMYHYARSGDPVANAKHFATEVGPLEPGEFVFLDVESGMTPSIAAITAMLHEFEAVYPGRVARYQGKYFASGDTDPYGAWPWILPAYPWPNQVIPVTHLPVAVWQWAGGAHGINVPGVGNVDSNMVIDPAALDRVCAITAAPPIPPPSAPEEDEMNPNRFVKDDRPNGWQIWEVGVDSKGQWAQTTTQRGIDWTLYNAPTLDTVPLASLQAHQRPPVSADVTPGLVAPHRHDNPATTLDVSP